MQQKFLLVFKASSCWDLKLPLSAKIQVSSHEEMLNTMSLGL